MFFFLGSGLSRKQTVQHRLLLQQTVQSQSPVVVSVIPKRFPVTYARTPTQWVFMFNGLSAPVKWNGSAYSAVTVGVPAPATALTLSATGSGSITGTYNAYERFVDNEGNVSNLSPVSNSITVTNVKTIRYTGVPVPTDSKVVRRQLLRNTSGQQSTYYVDIDTTDLAATTFTSTTIDTTLRNETAVPLFDDEGNNLANSHGLPPDDKPIVAAYLGRMWAGGDVSYSEGSIELTYGSKTVQGIGTDWTTAFADRFLYVVGASRSYQIASCDPLAQTLTLTEEYRGATDPFGVYAVRSPPALRNQLFFTLAGEYDSWPFENTIAIEETGDEVTALISSDSFFYIVQRRHIHRLTYRVDPGIDGGIFPASYRGCVNHRSWVNVNGVIYMLDEQGIYAFEGRAQDEVAAPIQNIFWLEDNGVPFRINWSASRFIHAQHDKANMTIRWFVPLAGSYAPRHALCLNYGNKAWWVEECPWMIGASCVMESGTPHPVIGTTGRRVMAFGVGTLDGLDPADGTGRGSVTASSPTTLTDANATLPVAVNCPIALVDGRGKQQSRIVTSVSGTQLTLDRPLLISPDVGDTYQIGAIGWEWRSGWMRWLSEEQSNIRRLVLAFEPMGTPSVMDVRVFSDHHADPDKLGADWPTTPVDASGVTMEKDSPDMVVDLADEDGFAQMRLDASQEFSTHSSQYVSIDLRGFSAESLMRLYGLTVEGAR